MRASPRWPAPELKTRRFSSAAPIRPRYRWAGKGGSLFQFDSERKIGFAYVMNGMMNGGAGGARTARFYEVLMHK